MTEASTDDPCAYLGATCFIDSDHPRVREFAKCASASADTSVGVARDLFLAVRDGLRYNPYTARLNDPDNCRASTVLTLPGTWCVLKAVTLTAVARGIFRLDSGLLT